MPGESVLEGLRGRGLCEKASVVERSGECLLVYCKSVVGAIIAFAEYDGWFYAKAVPEEGLPAHMWHCDQVFYTPYGLYAFGRSLGEVLEKLAAKRRLLEAIARLAGERAAAMGLE